MKRVFALLLFTSFHILRLHAQDTALLDSLCSTFRSSCVSMDFECTLKAHSGKESFDGNLSLQGDAYVLSVHGTDVFCDGEYLWYVDTAAAEVLIERMSGSDERYLQNPALLFDRMDDSFRISDVSESGNGVPAGQNYVVYTLVPVMECGVEKCILRIGRDGNLRHGTFAMSDGTVAEVTIMSMTKTDRKSITSFRPDIDADSSWVITDLR